MLPEIEDSGNHEKKVLLIKFSEPTFRREVFNVTLPVFELR